MGVHMYIGKNRRTGGGSYRRPDEAGRVNATNQDELIDALRMKKDQKASSKKAIVDEFISKSGRELKKDFPEDTVSEEEYLSSSGESDEEAKKGESKASSSHSRFSSNLGEIQAEIE